MNHMPELQRQPAILLDPMNRVLFFRSNELIVSTNFCMPCAGVALLSPSTTEVIVVSGRVLSDVGTYT